MTHGYNDKMEMRHYCEGTWRKGWVLDCEYAEAHSIKLMQTDAKYKATVERLEKSGRYDH